MKGLGVGGGGGGGGVTGVVLAATHELMPDLRESTEPEMAKPWLLPPLHVYRSTRRFCGESGRYTRQ